jgi:hypothetical protein
MQPIQKIRLFVLWLTAGMILAGCSGGSQRAGVPSAPATSAIGSLSAATATSAPAATRLLVPDPVQLTILHTNDNWGATEPCG